MGKDKEIKNKREKSFIIFFSNNGKFKKSNAVGAIPCGCPPHGDFYHGDFTIGDFYQIKY